LRDVPLGVASQHNNLSVCRIASSGLTVVVATFISKCLLGSLAIFTMADNKEQTVCVKFWFLLRKSAAKLF